jgi:superfamily II helicase
MFKEARAIAARLILLTPEDHQEVTDRLARYETKVGGLHMCPRCWMELEAYRPIRSMQQERKYLELCFSCQTEFPK